MSYKYGTNGNDVNWDAVESLHMYCLDCISQEVELKTDLQQVMRKYHINRAGASAVMDAAMEALVHTGECCGHTHVYCPSGVNLQLLFRRGRKLETVVPWYILHDTNGNFVKFVGHVPDEYMSEDYKAERKCCREERRTARMARMARLRSFPYKW